jgi:hypothetical protein
MFIATMTVAYAQMGWQYYRGDRPQFSNPYIYHGPIGRGYGGWQGPNVRERWFPPQGYQYRYGMRGMMPRRRIEGF